MLVEMIICSVLSFVLGMIIEGKMNRQAFLTYLDINRRMEETLMADIKALEAKLGEQDRKD